MQDVRDALRALRANPIVASVAILSLALGIGANTAIFSILNSLLLKPLPVRAPGELVLIDSASDDQYFSLSHPVWREIRERHLFERAFAWGTDRLPVSTGTETASADMMWASGELFD